MLLYNIPTNICTHLYIGGNSVQHLRYFLRRPRRHDHTTRSSCNQSRFFPFFLEGFSISFFLSPFIYILICSHLYTSVYIIHVFYKHTQAHVFSCNNTTKRFFPFAKDFRSIFPVSFLDSLSRLSLFFSHFCYFSRALCTVVL